MHRIDGIGATIDNKFTEGNPAAGVIATQVTDDILNAFQEEICGVILAAGIALDKANNGQLLAAIAALRTAAFTGTNQSLGTSGYQKLPGGLILQWGTFDATGFTAGKKSVTFPLAFPNAVFRVFLTDRADSLAQVHALGVEDLTISTTGFNLYAADLAGAATSTAGGFFSIGW